MDGQHRLNSIAKIRLKQKAENIQSQSDTIPVLVADNEDVKNVNEYIISINNTSNSWKNKDYIENADKIKNEDPLIRTIQAFSNLGFSLSSISRWICFNKDSINAKTLAEYANHGKEIKHANHDRAIRLYKFLHGKGFSVSFLKKRYLIDIIIEEKKQSNDGSINGFLNKIEYLRRASYLNELKATKCNIEEEIYNIIEEDYKKVIDEAYSDNEKKTIIEVKDYLSLIEDEEIAFFMGYTRPQSESESVQEANTIDNTKDLELNSFSNINNQATRSLSLPTKVNIRGNYKRTVIARNKPIQAITSKILQDEYT